MQIQGKGKEFEYKKYAEITEEKAIQWDARRLMRDITAWSEDENAGDEALAVLDEKWRALAARVFANVEGLPSIGEIGGTVGLAEVTRGFFTRVATLPK